MIRSSNNDIERISKRICFNDEKLNEEAIEQCQILPMDVIAQIFECYAHGKPFGKTVPPFSLVCKEWALVADNSFKKLALEYFIFISQLILQKQLNFTST